MCSESTPRNAAPILEPVTGMHTGASGHLQRVQAEAGAGGSLLRSRACARGAARGRLTGRACGGCKSRYYDRNRLAFRKDAAETWKRLVELGCPPLAEELGGSWEQPGEWRGH